MSSDTKFNELKKISIGDSATAKRSTLLLGSETI